MKKLLVFTLFSAITLTGFTPNLMARDYGHRHRKSCHRSSHHHSHYYKKSSCKYRGRSYNHDHCDRHHHHHSGISIRIGSGHHHHHHNRRKVWVSGYYSYTTQKVLIPGYFREVYVEPIFENRLCKDGKTYIKVMVQEGYTKRVWVPERYEYQRVKVWVPGHWEYR